MAVLRIPLNGADAEVLGDARLHDDQGGEVTQQEWQRLWHEGYTARTLGKRRDQCPYKAGIKADAWEAGWMRCNEERR